MGQPSPTIVMGIDPGSRITGYGIISVLGNHYRCLDYGAIRCHSRAAQLPRQPSRPSTTNSAAAPRHAPAVWPWKPCFTRSCPSALVGQPAGGPAGRPPSW